jgi:hypothetical protein
VARALLPAILFSGEEKAGFQPAFVFSILFSHARAERRAHTIA